MIKIPGLETYYGGKGASGTPQTIINQIPPHDYYYSLFAGGCKITCNKKPATKINFIIDIDKHVIDCWNKASLPDNFFTEKNDSIMILESIAKDTNLVNETVFLYLDPPYLLESRKSSKKQYNHELTKNDHIRILKAITEIDKRYHNNIFIGISCLENDLYKEYLKNWRLIKFWNQTRRGKQLEYLYMNYPEPTVLHQYNYLGKDYREREKIQNQIKRNVIRLKNMNPVLRNAIVTAINEEININN
jgi:site-specific DNA-adenine methylase